MVPSVSVGKLRRALTNAGTGEFTAQLFADRIIGVHFVGWIGRGSSAAHDIHLPLKLSARVSPVGSRYGGNRADRIRHRIIDKGVGRIGKSASRDIAAATRVDEAADGRRRYIAERNWQDSILLHPAGRARSKLPDLVYPLPSA